MFFVSNPHSVLQMQMQLCIKRHPSGPRLTVINAIKSVSPTTAGACFSHGGHRGVERSELAYWRSQDVQVFGCC